MTVIENNPIPLPSWPSRMDLVSLALTHPGPNAVTKRMRMKFITPLSWLFPCGLMTCVLMWCGWVWMCDSSWSDPVRLTGRQNPRTNTLFFELINLLWGYCYWVSYYSKEKEQVIIARVVYVFGDSWFGEISVVCTFDDLWLISL